MPDNLSSFTELMKKAAADKAVREEAERARKEQEVVPLLSELFQTVAKAKQVPHKNAPITHQIVPESIIPEKTTQPIKNETNAPESVLLDRQEKQFVDILNKLQKQIGELQKRVDNRPTIAPSWGTSGSGEVRILRMDDVIRETPDNNDLMVWDSSINKFTFQPPNNLLTVTKNVISEETVIPVDTSYQIINYLNLKSTLIVHGNVKIT
jgi:hypothetical protein